MDFEYFWKQFATDCLRLRGAGDLHQNSITKENSEYCPALPLTPITQLTVVQLWQLCTCKQMFSLPPSANRMHCKCIYAKRHSHISALFLYRRRFCGVRPTSDPVIMSYGRLRYRGWIFWELSRSMFCWKSRSYNINLLTKLKKHFPNKI